MPIKSNITQNNNNNNIERSKSQCIILPSYNKYSCLIIGGKNYK
jgi:hypothetical protein